MNVIREGSAVVGVQHSKDFHVGRELLATSSTAERIGIGSEFDQKANWILVVVAQGSMKRILVWQVKSSRPTISVPSAMIGALLKEEVNGPGYVVFSMLGLAGVVKRRVPSGSAGVDIHMGMLAHHFDHLA